MRLIWTAAALRDVAAIHDFIGRDNPHAARQVLIQLFAAVTMLRVFPESGRPGRRAGTRELVVSRSSYIIAYQPHPDRVEILRVLHGHQRWPGQL